MNTVEFADYKTIINTIHHWPVASRLALIQDVLKTLTIDLTSNITDTSTNKNTLSKALGLLATKQPAPSDDEVKELLTEARLEKYGL